MRPLQTGDVIEVETEQGWATALVLLANDEAAIIDWCDGSVPRSVLVTELGRFRIFEESTDHGIDALTA